VSRPKRPPLKLAIVGSASYPVEHVQAKLAEYRSERGPCRFVLVGGDEEFSTRVQELARKLGIPAGEPRVSMTLWRMCSIGDAQATNAVARGDLLLAFWDGASVDATQLAVQVALDAGKPFEVFGPDGTTVRAGNLGRDVRVPGKLRHG
jgi:hypothetical protein